MSFREVDDKISELTRQTIIFGLYNESSKSCLIFKYYIYIKKKMHTKCRYFNCQLNENKEKGKANKPCYEL